MSPTLLGLAAVAIGLLALAGLLVALARPERLVRHKRAVGVLALGYPLVCVALALGLVQSTGGYPGHGSLRGSFRLLGFEAAPPSLYIWVAAHPGGLPRVLELVFGAEIGAALEDQRAALARGDVVYIRADLIDGPSGDAMQEIDFVDASWRPTRRIVWDSEAHPHSSQPPAATKP